jgi:uncharacterized membrane protein HdeD (DUF308 family)
MATDPKSGFHLIGLDELKRNWGWFLALGVLLVVLGVIALGAAALVTLFSALVFGWLLLIGGVFTALHAFMRRRWSGFFIDLVAGILYFVAGLMIVGHPVAGAATITLVIAVFLLIGGIFRIAVALSVPFGNRWWLLLNGVITFGLGAYIWFLWPLDSFWVIGMFVGIDMIFYGWSLVMLGLTAKAAPPPL